jgi:uncharacterized protein
VVRVKVLDVDVPRKRISLTLRLEDEAAASSGPPRTKERRPQQRPQQQQKPADTALADALRRAGLA